MIMQLVIQLGPPAFQLIQDLIAVWHKPDLTPEEVKAIVEKSQKSYDEYIAEARQSIGPP